MQIVIIPGTVDYFICGFEFYQCRLLKIYTFISQGNQETATLHLLFVYNSMQDFKFQAITPGEKFFCDYFCT